MFNKIEFIEDCKTLTIEQLRLKYKCRVQKLKKLMKELNILYINKIGKVIKWKADYTYFEVVDVPEKAYWLGLLYADGCISNCKSRIFNISLELIDLEVIERFKKDLNIESPIHIRKYKNLNHNTAYSISFKSEKVFNDLNRLGCFTNKTFTLEFPTEEQVPIHLLSHFIRGYFDGDGCIYIKNYHKAKATIAGNLMFSNGLVNHINNILFFNNKLTKNKNIYIFSVQGTNKIKTFLIIYIKIVMIY